MEDTSYANGDRAIPVGRIEFGPQSSGLENAWPDDSKVLNRLRPKLTTATEIKASKHRPSYLQGMEREALAKDIFRLITEFTERTGLVVEDIDIELDDSLFWWSPEKQARYQAVKIKAVLP